MRIHRLELHAFGPFAGRESIDFDDVAANGLFLLNGPTGAGKTSILDAICYALYGDVPGARQSGVGLRSQHAEAETKPWLECEFTAQDRRFRVHRDLPWHRPSTRASRGYVEEKAQALLQERIDGQWQAVTTRNEEVGKLVTDVLGMKKDQFTRVVMLPQGEFANFLRAEAKERGELLQKLFGTVRFEQVEQAAAEMAREASEELRVIEERRQSLRRQGQAEARELSLAAVGHDVDAAEAQLLPDREAGQAENGAITPLRPESAEFWDQSSAWDQALLWATTVVSLLEQQHQDLAADAAQASERCESLKQQRHNLAQLLSLSERILHHRGRSGTAESAGARLAADAKAQTLSVPHHRLVDARASHETALHNWRQPDVVPEETLLKRLRTEHQDLDQLRAEISARIPDEIAAGEQREAEVAARQRLEHSLSQGSARAERRSLLVREQEGLQARAAELAEAPLALEQARHRKDQAEQGLRLHEALLEVQQRVATSAAVAADARAAALDAKELWLASKQAQLDHAAATLAATLVDGEACPVCGSHEHPDAARGQAQGEDLVAREKRRRQAHEQAEQDHSTAQAEATSAAERQAALLDQGASEEAETIAAALEHAEAALAQAQSQLSERDRCRERLVVLGQELEAIAQEEAAHEERAAAAGREADTAAAQARALQARVEVLLDGYPSLAARLGEISDQVQELGRTVEAGQKVLETQQALSAAEQSFTQALSASELASEAELLEALLRAEDRAELSRLREEFAAEAAALKEREQDEAIAAARVMLLSQPGQGGQSGLPSDDPEALRTAVEEYDAQLQETEDAALHAATERAADLEEANTVLSSARQIHRRIAAWAREEAEVVGDSGPLVERATRLNALASAFRGAAGDNLKRMSLSSYVLAARLEQVAESASQRLATMSDGRYALEHSDARERNGRKSGLGLVVLDGWTGHRRDTSSLSGGESFMASLALALGLADVVQAESGGIAMESLFVDEGFGTLDEQALNQVMDSLEGLLAGGRMVGLVSHVAELKQRIPAQIHLVRTRTGSHIRSVKAAVEV